MAELVHEEPGKAPWESVDSVEEKGAKSGTENRSTDGIREYVIRNTGPNFKVREATPEEAKNDNPGSERELIY